MPIDLNLESKIVLDKETINSKNLCDQFTDKDLTAIGCWVVDGYQRDEGSRERWLRRTEAAMDLALQIQKDKTYPWANCSNIAFPLITIAVMQFHARAYPALVSDPDLVKSQVVGPDEDGKKTARADRISTHMSWQCLEQDDAWEEQHDRLLINLATVGTAFKKTYYSERKDHNVSELVLARDLVIDYWAKSVDETPRKTHKIPLYRNDVYERVRRGTYRDVLGEAWYNQAARPDASPEKTNQDNRQGMTVPQSDDTTPFTFLEQHCSLDLDQDGYAEPYIVTVEKASGFVVRIVTRFDRPEDIERDAQDRVISIHAMEYFTKYPFIPSPDGGIYDIGFGVLLGPLNESVNTIVNQLVDSGTMYTLGGGFLGRGAKIRGGPYTFSPLEWKRVDSTGDDLRKSIVPLEVREPSTVLFQLLGFIVQYVNRVSGSTEMMVGENPGQNTPAQTAETMVEQGQQIYSALFKRMWRAMKQEFGKLYVLNAIFLPDKAYFGRDGAFALREDYLGDPSTVIPQANPNVTSRVQQVKLALTVADRAKTVPGYDVAATEKMVLRVLDVETPELIYPGPDKVPQGEPLQITVQKLKNEAAVAKEEAETARLQFELQNEQMQFAATLMEQRMVNEAQIVELQAKATKAMAEAQGESVNQQIGFLNAMVAAAKTRNDHINTQLDTLVKAMAVKEKARGTGKSDGK